ncbi:MAG: DUF4446 family protein [Actinomycetota bacterium]
MDQDTLIKAAPVAIAIFALVIALAGSVRLTSARRSLKLLQGTFNGQTLVDAVATYVGEVKGTQQNLNQLAKRHEELAAMLGRSARNLAVIRFDAFEEMGGRLSFSAAWLNDYGTGVVLTSINGRSESRVYAKEVQEGVSEHTLSPEEQQAVSEALGRKRKVRTDRG